MKLLGIEDGRLRRGMDFRIGRHSVCRSDPEFTEEVRKLGRNPLVKRETAA